MASACASEIPPTNPATISVQNVMLDGRFTLFGVFMTFLSPYSYLSGNPPPMGAN